jgi:hypothetical protein
MYLLSLLKFVASTEISVGLHLLSHATFVLCVQTCAASLNTLSDIT